MKIRAIAIDDEPRALEVIRYHSEKIPFLELLDSFRNPFKATSYFNKNDVDLIFLDINMPDISGIQYVETFEQQPMIIFTTAYSEFAVESYELNAVDYLVKPIQLDRFTKAANKAYQSKKLKKFLDTTHQKEAQEKILIKCGSDFRKIAAEAIRYVKSDGNYMVFYLELGSMLLSRMTIKETLDLLPSKLFSQVHRSYIVNHNHIDVFKNDSLVIENEEISVGNTYRKQLLDKFGL